MDRLHSRSDPLAASAARPQCHANREDPPDHIQCTAAQVRVEADTSAPAGLTPGGRHAQPSQPAHGGHLPLTPPDSPVGMQPTGDDILSSLLLNASSSGTQSNVHPAVAAPAPQFDLDIPDSFDPLWGGLPDGFDPLRGGLVDDFDPLHSTDAEDTQVDYRSPRLDLDLGCTTQVLLPDHGDGISGGAGTNAGGCTLQMPCFPSALPPPWLEAPPQRAGTEHMRTPASATAASQDVTVARCKMCHLWREWLREWSTNQTSCSAVAVQQQRHACCDSPM